ncbi:MAG TPA: LLM class flavin-dependent oxidoreductase [Ktedonobacterales bacterium]|jgi:alkanesulfonate monooxygenase SsuD/methylene tetrahydromethanopterin reductase-like flavin-dependent oxidoreductase (luciferase family)
MRYGFILPGGDARQVAEAAREAEAAGWDGFFVADCVWSTDPWVSLTAAAMLTERIRLGTMLTPVSRRRPWTLASQTATLDHLSGGRVILAVGLGALDTGFESFGEVTDRKTRAELLDEGLAIIAGLWAGQPFAFDGQHYHVRETTFAPPPPPAQRPRIPVWVVGAWPRPKSMERVARWDGLLPDKLNADGQREDYTPDDLRAMAAWLAERRPTDAAPIDIIVEGETPGDDPLAAQSIVQPMRAAGATWWLESRWGDGRDDEARRRIRQGPPAES